MVWFHVTKHCSLYYVYLYRNLCLNIKAVEGSGSEGAPKYVGEGVTYGVFMVVFMHARTCRCTRIRLLTRDVGRHAQLLTSSRRNVVIWCRKEH